MKTITSKTAINGAKLWYVDGKRTSRDKAVETSIANGRENLSNLMTGLTSDDNQNFGIVADMKSEFGDRYVERFYFATAEDAVTAAKKIVALGKQVYRLTIDNGRPYPSNIRYADTVRGKLIFINGFERFNEGNEEKPATVEVNEKPATVTKTETDGHIDGFDESAFDALPNFDDEEDDDELIDPPETTAEVNDLPEVKPEFKRYGSFKVKAAHMDTTIKAVSFGGITNHSRDKPTSRKEVTSMSEFDEACWQIWKRHGHKHRWHIGRDSRGEAYPYRVGEGGEEVVADNCDDDECREVEEQLGMIYLLKEDYPGLLVSGWYDEDDPRLKGGCNESYSWREVESGYYRDVL